MRRVRFYFHALSVYELREYFQHRLDWRNGLREPFYLQSFKRLLFSMFIICRLTCKRKEIKSTGGGVVLIAGRLNTQRIHRINIRFFIFSRELPPSPGVSGMADAE